MEEPTSAEWVIGEWVTLDRELHPFEALELATVIEAVKLHVLHGWPRWWAWTSAVSSKACRRRTASHPRASHPRTAVGDPVSNSKRTRAADGDDDVATIGERATRGPCVRSRGVEQ